MKISKKINLNSKNSNKIPMINFEIKEPASFEVKKRGQYFSSSFFVVYSKKKKKTSFKGSKNAKARDEKTKIIVNNIKLKERKKQEM